MANRTLKVLFVSAEVAPFSSVGGLSQVSYFLPRALLKLGVDVRIFTPKYAIIDEKRFPMSLLVGGLRVPTGSSGERNEPTELVCNIKSYGETKKGEPTVYFLENMEYYEKRANVYDYNDDHIRFGLLSRGALEFIKQEFFKPDVIHANDWHTGYLLNFLRTEYAGDPTYKKIAGLLSVHNLFQGQFDFEHASEMDFDDGKGPLAAFFDERFYKQNPLKRGVINADLVNTVSETYSREIMTDEHGRGLQHLFKELRGKLFGVLNGLDYNDFNPATDRLLKQNYNQQSINRREINKVDLQKQFNLEANPKVPLLASWGRLDSQKGIDLIMDTIEFVLEEFNAQFIIMGRPGEDRYRSFFTELEKKYPGRVGTHLMANFTLPRQMASGADIFTLPSRYEPGGIVAMEAMRYGCVPLVRATGGLADIVENYNPEKGSGTGFTFKTYTRENFLVAITRAIESYRNPDNWRRIVRRAMDQDNSWEKAGRKYQDLYDRAIEFRKEALTVNPPAAFRQTV